MFLGTPLTGLTYVATSEFVKLVKGVPKVHFCRIPLQPEISLSINWPYPKVIIPKKYKIKNPEKNLPTYQAISTYKFNLCAFIIESNDIAPAPIEF